jgi:nucleoside-diphosphate-sugar epimerase
MKIAIAGAHGQIALRLTRLLTAKGDTVTGLIRNPDHASEVRQAGATPALSDLERTSVEQLAKAIAGSDAVVFAAGAGPGSGAQRKITMDRDGAIKLLGAATAAGVRRYVIISGAGVEDPPTGDEVFEIYLRAKAEADAAVETSALDWTILRPGGLTDDPGTGNVRIDTAPFSGSIPRDDVAAVIARVLPDPQTNGRILYVSSGTQRLDDALRDATGPAS